MKKYSVLLCSLAAAAMLLVLSFIGSLGSGVQTALAVIAVFLAGFDIIFELYKSLNDKVYRKNRMHMAMASCCRLMRQQPTRLRKRSIQCLRIQCDERKYYTKLRRDEQPVFRNSLPIHCSSPKNALQHEDCKAFWMNQSAVS